ncbi:MAG: DUF4375 domain-containing protein [Bacteroidia bacterium]|nr:DUF4375 domain-containing protein [Bacteroidia bacterium]
MGQNKKYEYVELKSIEELPSKYWDINVKDYITTIAFEEVKDESDIAKQEESITTFIKGLPQKIRLIFTVYDLDTEVHNGTYEQYFSNFSGNYKDVILSDLEYLGAEEIAIITDKAIKGYQSFESKGFPEDEYEDFIRSVTDEFYKAYEGESLHELSVEFIRENIEYFKHLDL